jgi:hypothetical protein
MPTPQAALIEIVERTDSPDPRVIVPNEVRINGVPLLAPADEPIVLHEVRISDGEMVRVTLTLYARRIVVGTEPKAEAL